MQWVSAALLCLALSTDTTAQQQIQTIQIGPGGAADGMPIQLPGAGRQLKTGTGRIRGRLATADTGSPVRRAQVRVSGPDIMPKMAITDAEGRYEFKDLPAGRFNISATKAGFVTVNYGQTRPFETGKAIDLGEAQVVDKADITMPRGSAISGRIVDEFGEPLADAQVSALRSAWGNGRRRLTPTGRTAQTNDLGQYRIYGLPPGEYYVSATLRGGAEMMFVEGVAATFVTGGGPGASGSEPRSGYAPTYFPGTANGSEAQKIQLPLGQEMQSADFSLLPVRLVKVSGTVVGSDGRPVEGAMLQVVPRNNSDAGSAFFSMAGSARSDRNGQFTLNGVAPGEYTLQVRGTQMITTTGGGDTMMFSTRVNMGGGEGAEFGSVPLSVAGEDVSNVMVATSKGAAVSGRVTFEGGSKPANTAPLRISAMLIDNEAPMGMPGGSASVSSEGAFEIKGLMGPRLIRPTGLPAGWALKSVTVNGADVTDSGITIKPNEPVGNIEVVLTSKMQEVTGGVTAGNQPATDYTVVVFSEDAEKWTAPMTRYVTFTRPNQQGRYRVTSLPPGSYYAIAVDYIAQGDWNDPEVLTRLKAQATRFSLSEGEVQTLDLKLSGN
jgi:protocatechuate 3,4-dioxygenase beta subunit